MPRNIAAESLSSLREQSERLWHLSDHIVTTESSLEARSIAAQLDELADQLGAAFDRLCYNSN